MATDFPCQVSKCVGRCVAPSDNKRHGIRSNLLECHFVLFDGFERFGEYALWGLLRVRLEEVLVSFDGRNGIARDSIRPLPDAVEDWDANVAQRSNQSRERNSDGTGSHDRLYILGILIFL